MSTSCGVYIIKNINNNKMYIGSSIDLDSRWKHHIYSLNNNKHHSWKLQDAWNKDGQKCFIFDILEMCDELNVKQCEQKWISLLSTHITGYNILDRVDYISSKNINKNGNYIEINKFKSNIKLSNASIEKLSCIVTKYECWFIFKLLKYITKHDNILKYNNIFITIDDIVNITGFHKTVVYDTIKSLCDKNIFKKHKIEENKCIIVNPYIFMISGRIKKEIADLFKDTIWNIDNN